MFLKHDFFMFWGILGTFNFSFFGLRGGENFWTRREGGAKNFGRVAKGGEKFWTCREGGGGEKFWTANFFGILRGQ